MDTSAPPELRTRRLPFRLLLYGFALVFAASAAIGYVDAVNGPIVLTFAFATLAVTCLLIAHFSRDATLIKWAGWLSRFGA